MQSIELQKVEEELTELMVESVLIFHAKLTFKCGPPKKQSMLKRKEKQDKSQREKFQWENHNDLILILKI